MIILNVCFVYIVCISRLIEINLKRLYEVVTDAVWVIWYPGLFYGIEWGLNEDWSGWFKDTPAEGGTLQKLEGVLPTCVTFRVKPTISSNYQIKRLLFFFFFLIIIFYKRFVMMKLLMIVLEGVMS